MGEAKRRAVFDETWGPNSKAPLPKPDPTEIFHHFNYLLEEDEFLWIKIGNTTFYLVYRNTDGTYEVHPSTGSGMERQVSSQSFSLEAFINLCEKKEGGGFFISGVNAPLPKKEMMGHSRVIKAEIDGMSFNEQAEAYRKIMGDVGFDPILLTSGGESLHFQQPLDQLIPVSRQTYYERLLCLLVGGDPAVAQPQQPVRLAGVLRKGKGLQELIAEGHPISEERLIGSFDRAFENRGWVKPDEIPDDWWHEFRPIIGMPVMIREMLAKGYLKWKEEKKFGQRRHGGKTIDTADYRVPLSYLCSRRVRDLLSTGTPQGSGRYDDLKSVQREVFPIQDYLISIGQPFEESAEELTYQFGKLSGMTDREIERYMFGDKEHKPITNGNGRVDNRIEKWVKQQRWTPRIDPQDPVKAKGKAAVVLAKGNVKDRQFAQFKAELMEHKAWLGLKTKPKKEDNRQFKEVITIKAGDQKARLEAYKMIDGEKYKYAHDKSTVGSGKSRAAGLMENAIFISNKDYRNPTTETLKHNFKPLPVRSAFGIFDVNGRLVNDPPEEIRQGLEPVSPANCPFGQVGREIFEKNYEEAFTKGESGICGLCPKFRDCQRDGLRKEKMMIEAHMAGGGNVRGHIAQLFPINEKMNDPGAPAHKKRVFIDEAGEIEPTNVIPVTSHAMAEGIRKLTELASGSDETEFFMEIIRIVGKLSKLAKDPKEFGLLSDGYYGIDEEKVKYYMGECPEIVKKKMEEFITELTPALSDFVDKFEPTPGERDDAYTREVEAIGIAQQMHDRVKELAMNWLPTLLRVWAGEYEGTVHMDINGTLFITYKEYNLGELANANHGGLTLLDATARTIDLAKMYNIPPEEIVIIQEEAPDLSNLIVHSIDIPGIRSYDWAEDAINRVKLLTGKIQYIHPDAEIITLKKNKEKIGAKYHYGLHNRGTNIFKDKNALTLVGTPWMNLGAARRNYRILYGSLEGFEEYYQHLVEQELFQAYGRLRAQWTNDPKHLFIIGTNLNLDWLAEEYGCQIDQVDVAEFCPEALKGIEKVYHYAKETARGIIEAGKKLTQLAIANAMGVTQSYVSRAINRFGGSWEKFKFLVQNLVNNIKDIAVKPESEGDGLAIHLKYAEESDIEELYLGYMQLGMDWLVAEITDLGCSIQSVTELVWLMTPWFDENIQRISWEVFAMFDSC